MLQVSSVKSDQQIDSFLRLAQQQLNQSEVFVHIMISCLPSRPNALLYSYAASLQTAFLTWMIAM